MAFAHLKNLSIYSLQVFVEGVAGVTFASNIALDDFNFSTNLTCVSVGKPTPPETFQGNVTFLIIFLSVRLHCKLVLRPLPRKRMWRIHGKGV